MLLRTDKTSTLLLGILAHLCHFWILPLRRKRAHRRAKRRGVLVRLKAALRHDFSASFGMCGLVPRLSYPFRVLDPTDACLVPVCGGQDGVFQSRGPCVPLPCRRRVNPSNLRPLCRVYQMPVDGVDPLISARIGLCFINKVGMVWYGIPGRGVCPTFPADPNYMLGPAKSVRLSPPPVDPTHHHVVFSGQLGPSLHPSVQNMQPKIGWILEAVEDSLIKHHFRKTPKATPGLTLTYL
ncbi:hypothetical protein ILYODFUR_021531 [Ilyodon furcidens]|uniref:Uncharacterized protein n=1 Tax=Ilyodon furcidens TaxID=33524 RepID=A0ABV0TWJ4_9TELE